MKGLSPPTQRSKLGCCHFRRQNEPTEIRCWFVPGSTSVDSGLSVGKLLR